MAEMDVRVDNPDELRYELWVGATRAGFIEYRSEPGIIVLVHPEVEPRLRGAGAGGSRPGWPGVTMAPPREAGNLSPEGQWPMSRVPASTRPLS
jgi:hypothetical protein